MPRGPAAYEPTAEQRRLVETMAGYGIEQLEICKHVINPKSGKPLSPKTLRKAFRDELDTGMTKANAKVVESLFILATGAPAVYDANGNLLREEQKRWGPAAIFWTKARMGWRDTTEIEMSGKNGGPVPLEITKNQSQY